LSLLHDAVDAVAIAVETALEIFEIRREMTKLLKIYEIVFFLIFFYHAMDADDDCDEFALEMIKIE